MCEQKNKRMLILLAVGANCVFWGMMLKSYGIIGDELNGFLIGFGIVLEVAGLFKTINSKRCGSKLS